MKEYLKTTPESFKIESKVIEWMRFPLVILVAFVHVPHKAENIIEWLWSDTIASMAVPLFFIISGFYIFII